jgi:hypothetical protein
MARVPPNDPTKDADFQKVVRHFLSTPPKPHSAEPKRQRQTDEELKAEALDNWDDEGGAAKPKRKAEKKKPPQSNTQLRRP